MGRTVLIVDDHSVFRSRARRMLESEGYRVIGEAADGASAISAARDLRPEVVLLDVQLPDTNGFDVADELAGAGSDAKIVMISGRDPRPYRDRLSHGPARGFIPKAELSAESLAAML